MVFGIFRGRPPPLTPVDLRGRSVVVTGASAGIGVETARAFARWGADVTIVGRDRARTEAVARELGREAAGTVHAELADFAVLAEVRALASRLVARLPRLDVLVNNAGLWLTRPETTVDGHEKTFAVNHLAPFLLTNLLLDALRAAPEARIVNVSSRLHDSAPPPDVAALRAPARFRGLSAYAASKLCNVLFSRELAERLRGGSVRSNAVHPGDVRTDVTRDHRVLAWLHRTVATPLLLSAEEGARTSVHVATSPLLAGTSGGYFVNCRPAPASPLAEDAALRRRLWDDTERLLAEPPAGSARDSALG
jgi:NAD(P)-dependent dehydrogenase (short-subunit alcohol dehydrogenase family)